MIPQPVGRMPGTYQEQIALANQKAELRELDTAETILKELIDDNPDDAMALFLYGYCMAQRWNHGLAVTFYKRAMEIASSRNIYPLINIGESLSRLWRHDEAIELLNKAMELEPDHPIVLLNLAHAHLWRGDARECIEYANRILEQDPGHIPALDNKSLALLFLGQWAEGWDMYEVSLGYKFRKEYVYGAEQRWQGTKGENLIVFGEQGLGDELLFCSCLGEVIRHSKRVYVDTSPKLAGLLQRSFPGADVHASRYDEAIRFDRDPDITARVAMGSLPRFYRRKAEYFSGAPYLVADPVKRRHWRQLLDDLGPGLKIGLAWRGGDRRTGRDARSLDIEELEQIWGQDATFVDLEYLPRYDKCPHVHHFRHLLSDDYDDTAALVAELDLVISICTSVVHLAGGLGTECWCLVPARPNWRFAPAAERNDGTFLWHKSVRLFRQTKHLQWGPVIDEVASALRLKLENPSHLVAHG